MAQFTVREAKTNLSKLIAAALVRLAPLPPRGRRCFGALKDKIAIDARFSELLPEDELGS